MIKKIVIIILFSFMGFLFGCNQGFSYGLGYGINIGESFSYPVAYRSDNSVLDIDDATLDFYYGYMGSNEISSYEDGMRICIYFVNHKGRDYIYTTNEEGGHDDFINIEGAYLVKEIPFDEFYTDEYLITKPYQWWRIEHYEFNHHEPFTIPKELLIDGRAVYFMVFLIWISEKSDKYIMGNIFGDSTQIRYELIDDGEKIRLI